MITGRGVDKKTGAPALILGITADNVRELQAGHPIRVPPERIAEVGIGTVATPLVVAIVYGEDQAALLAELEGGKPGRKST